MTAPQMCLRTITASSLCQHLSTEELRYQHYQSGLKQGPGVGAASSVPEPSLALAPAPVAVAAPAVATATAAAGTAPEAPTAVAEGATSRGPAQPQCQPKAAASMPLSTSLKFDLPSSWEPTSNNGTCMVVIVNSAIASALLQTTSHCLKMQHLHSGCKGCVTPEQQAGAQHPFCCVECVQGCT